MKTRRGAGPKGSHNSTAAAERLRLRPWSDPRLLLGVLLVLAATVFGARALAAADDTVEYWSLAHDVRAGDPVSKDDLVAVSVHLTGATAHQHLAVDDTFPADLDELQWSADGTEGALVARDDLDPRDTAASRQLPVTVAESAIPADLSHGDHVEVWVGAGPGDQDVEAATRVLDDVVVLRAATAEGALDGGGSTSVLLQVPADLLTGDVVSQVASGHVTLVRVP